MLTTQPERVSASAKGTGDFRQLVNKSLSVSHAAGRRACLLSTHVAQKDRRLVSRLGASLGPRWVTLLGPPAFRLSTPGSASESRRSQPASPPPAAGQCASAPRSHSGQRRSWNFGLADLRPARP